MRFINYFREIKEEKILKMRDFKENFKKTDIFSNNLFLSSKILFSNVSDDLFLIVFYF